MNNFFALTRKGRDDFFRYAESEIERSSRFLSASTIKNYRTAVTSLQCFIEGRRLRLEDVSHRLMSDYEHYLLHKGICLNTVSCYLRSLRSLYNRAVDKGLVEQRQPFRRVFTGNQKTHKRALSAEDVRKLHALPLPERSFPAMVRDVFLFCLFACGMPLVDAAHLKKSQIKDGRICYARRKTARLVSVRILPYMQRILDRYSSADDEYVFPLLKVTKNYPRLLLRYNRALAKLRREGKLQGSLTSYVCRHTWASLAFEKNVDVAVISRGLGHTSLRTTQIYLADINIRRLDEANRKLIKEVLDKEDVREKPLS